MDNLKIGKEYSPLDYENGFNEVIKKMVKEETEKIDNNNNNKLKLKPKPKPKPKGRKVVRFEEDKGKTSNNSNTVNSNSTTVNSNSTTVKFNSRVSMPHKINFV